MKYFIKLDDRMYTVESEVAHEVYRDLENKTLIVGTADEYHKNGTSYTFMHGQSGIWGEDISDEELFKRILNGDVHLPDKEQR